jgi:hypothetical protein
MSTTREQRDLPAFICPFLNSQFSILNSQFQ